MFYPYFPYVGVRGRGVSIPNLLSLGTLFLLTRRSTHTDVRLYGAGTQCFIRIAVIPMVPAVDPPIMQILGVQPAARWLSREMNPLIRATLVLFPPRNRNTAGESKHPAAASREARQPRN